MGELVPLQDHVQLNLPLEPRAARRLEVELFAGRVRDSRRERFELLERLAACGLAARDKVRILRGIHELPLSELANGTLLGANFYIKLCFDEGELREAKAYLGFMPKVRPALMGHAFPHSGAS